jgi:pyruvate-formate lyase-activating enzyme
MNDLEYKRTVLDPKSASFCGAKWYNATVWLGSGMTTSCHHPLPHKIDAEAVKTNPKLLHNTPEKKEQRRQMQCGERPAGCEYCWKIEDMGPDYISDRIYKSNIYTNKELDDAFRTDYNEDVNLRTLEIAFDRTCNFSCSYCNPAFSSSWVKDIKNNGPYGGLRSDGRNHFTHTHDSNQLYGYGEYNPYVEAFFKWWESDLHKTLVELRVTGGEPLMSADLWKLIDWFTENVDKSKTKLAINSNLGGKPDLINKLCDVGPKLPSLDVYTSCEAIGESCNYIRDGMDYDLWWNNLCKVHDAGISTHCMMTVNALCLQTLPNLIINILDERKTRGKEFAVFSLNILRFPRFQSCLVLPQHLRNICAFKLDKLFYERQHEMHEFEKGQVTRLIEYLRTVEKPHNEAFEMPRLHNDFKQFYTQYDIRRNKNFAKTFPELESWYESL